MPWHVRRVLESIAAQRTPRRMEVVVADDGSTDETPHLVREFAALANFPVRFVTHSHVGFHAALAATTAFATAPHRICCSSMAIAYCRPIISSSTCGCPARHGNLQLLHPA